VSDVAHSEMFERFLAGVNTSVGFNRDVIDEIPNIGALRLLHGEERIEAEDILIAMLAKNDGRAANALADVGCSRAIPALTRATTAEAEPGMRVFAARALLNLGSRAGRPAIVQMLRTHDGDTLARSMAADLLTEFPDPDKEVLLTAALTDPDGSVRSAATNAALVVWGLNTQDTLHGEVLMSIRGRMWSSLSTVRNEALAELRAVLARLDAGETAEQVGLLWRADMRVKPLRRLVDALDRDTTDYPVHGLEDLTGRERTLVENVVLLRLHEDRRAVRAAGVLGVHRAIEPLRELHRTAEGHARTEIESVLAKLTG
jgi:HEAT repeat protein